MTYIHNILEQPAWQALGWALLHFFWQGTLAALIWAAFQFALRNSSARIRYAVSCLFLMVLLAMPVVTLVVSWAPASAAMGTEAVDRIVAASHTTTVALPAIQESLAPFLPWIVAVWIAGVILLSVRWIGAWTYLRRLRRLVSLPVPPRWESGLRDLARRAAASVPVRLTVHQAAVVPCVIGWLRPVILMPAAFTGLDWQTIEAVLAHELAHIRRHDYLVNLLQTIVDTLLFYHPAVWLISRQIRIERENCCDDIASAICGDRAVYARALVDLEQMRAPETAFAMSARGGSLMRRIERLLRSSGASRRQGPAWPSAMAGLAIVLCLMAGLHPPVQAGGPLQASAPAPEPASSSDFLTGIIAAGFRNLTVDELIDLKIHGVTPAFAAAVKHAGYSNISSGDLVQFAIHGIDIDFIRDLRSSGLGSLSVSDLVTLRIQGVDAAYVRRLRDSGFRNLSVDQLLRLKRAGI